MNSIIDNVYNNIIEYSMISEDDSVIVGLSGGADSVMLLIALYEVKKRIKFNLAVAHVNHGIRGKSADDDCDFCAQLCSDLGIAFHSAKFDIPQISIHLKTSEENAGRIKRYEYFNKLCEEYGYNKIAVAHNMNDSVETVIINMIRGASLNGICGIKPVNSNIIRPLFNIARKEIENYLSENNISYRTDETNFCDDYTRNKIRNKLIKIMEEINPSVIKTIFNNTVNFKEDDSFISEFTKNINAITQENEKVIISKTIFDAQHIAVKKRIILEAFRKIKGDLDGIEKKHIDILLGELTSGKTYDMPAAITVSVSFDQIIFSHSKYENSYFEYAVNPGDTIKFSDSVVKISFSELPLFTDKNSIYIDFDKIKNNLVIRSRKSGDKFIPFGMNGSKKIKQLFSELKIPFVERDKIPLLCDGSEIAAVVPYRISEKYKISKDTTKVLKIQITKES